MQCDRYFTERIFWMQDTNTLIHVMFMPVYGWFSHVETTTGWYSHLSKPTYAELMVNYAHRNPELLLQEE